MHTPQSIFVASIVNRIPSFCITFLFHLFNFLVEFQFFVSKRILHLEYESLLAMVLQKLVNCIIFWHFWPCNYKELFHLVISCLKHLRAANFKWLMPWKSNFPKSWTWTAMSTFGCCHFLFIYFNLRIWLVHASKW